MTSEQFVRQAYAIAGVKDIAAWVAWEASNEGGRTE
jgi:hypothetical protein